MTSLQHGTDQLKLHSLHRKLNPLPYNQYNDGKWLTSLAMSCRHTIHKTAIRGVTINCLVKLQPTTHQNVAHCVSD